MGGTDLIVRFIGLDLVSRVAERAGNSMDRLENRVRRSGVMASQSLIAAGVAATTMGISFLAASGMAVAAAMKFVDMAAQFDSDMTMVVTHAGLAKTAVDRVSAALIRMAPAVGFGPDALALAFYHIQSASTSLPPKLQSISSELDILQQAAKLAAIGHAGLVDTTNTLIAVLTAYGVRIHSASDAAAMLNAIVGNGNVTMQQFDSAMRGGLLATAAQAHVSIQSLGAAFGTLTDMGYGASQSATYLRSAIIQMSMPSGPAAKALGAIGLSGDQVAKQMGYFNQVLSAAGVNQTEIAQRLASSGSLSDVLNNVLMPALKKAGLSGQQAAALIEKSFGGVRSGAAMIGLTNNLASLDQKEKLITRSTKDWADTWQYFTSHDPAFAMKQLEAAFQALEVVLGNALMPVFLAVVNFIGPLIQQFLAWANAHKQVVAAVAIAVIAITAFIGMVLTLGGFLLIITGSLGIIGSTIGALLAPIAEFAGAFMAFAGAEGTVAALGAAFGGLIGPVGIAAGIIALVVAAAMALRPEFDILGRTIGVFEMMLKKTHNTTAAFYMALLSLGVPFDTAKHLAFDLQLAITKLHQIFSIIGTAIANAFRKIARSIPQDDLVKLNIAAAKLAEAFQSYLLPVLGILILVIGSLLGGVFQALVNVLAVVIPGAIVIVTDVFDLLAGMFHFMGDLIGGFVAIVIDIIHGRWDLAWRDAKDTVAKLVTDLWNIFQSIQNLAVHAFQLLWNTVVALVTGLVGGVIGAFQNLWNTLVGHSIIPDMINAIISWFWRLPGLLYDAVNNATGGVLGEFMNLEARGLQIIAGAVGQFADAGYQIAMGIAQGIRNGVGAIIDAARNAASSALDAVKGFLGITSPSKLMAVQIGLPMMQGVAMGITQGAQAPRVALANVVNGISRVAPVVPSPRPATTSHDELGEVVTELRKQPSQQDSQRTNQLLQQMQQLLMQMAAHLNTIAHDQPSLTPMAQRLG